MFVFDTVEPERLPITQSKEWQGLPIDVEVLRVQKVRPLTRDLAEQNVCQKRFAKAPGGVSISPLGVDYAGTLGCYLLGENAGRPAVFLLSNNHVLADMDRLPVGTPIVQPGPEKPSCQTSSEDVLAELHSMIPLRFPVSYGDTQKNLFDAALALVTQPARIAKSRMAGGISYDPSKVVTPKPGMRVVKVGRATGPTRGIITGTQAKPVKIDYGTPEAPRLAVFDRTVTIVGDAGQPFSLPGDSGAVILEERTGHPLALLMAGDGISSTACELGPLCEQWHAWPL